MFDVGILELFIVGVIALLVLGPQRLPKAAQQAGRWIGYAKRTASQWSDEINRQIENEEITKELKKNSALEELNKELVPINQAFSQSLSGYALGGENKMPASTEINTSGTAKSTAINDTTSADHLASASSITEEKLSASA